MKPWRRAVLRPIVRWSHKATPRLERALTRLPESAGIAGLETADAHEARLLAYLRDLAALPTGDGPSFTFVTDGTHAETDGSLRLQVWPHWDVIGFADVAAGAPVAGDYVIPLRRGDRVYPSALAEIVRAIWIEERLGQPRPAAVYSDEQPVDELGRPAGDPIIKPDWSPILQRSIDYVGGLVAYRRDVFEESRGRGASERARFVGERHGMTHIPLVLVQGRLRGADEVTPFRPMAETTASIIIPTRDRAELLIRCVDSLRRTDHPAYDVVIVDNGSTDAAALEALRRWQDDGVATVISCPGPFNYARLIHEGVKRSQGDVIVMLNNDTEVVTPEWLRLLCGMLEIEGVGAAGPQLRYPDGTIQHAGLSSLGSAGMSHLFVARQPSIGTPLHLAQLPREVLAITGACLAVRREAFHAVGGLDEDLVHSELGDVDLCLRLRDAGRSSVYVPDAVLVHREGATRTAAFNSVEWSYLARRWPGVLLTDPYFSPRLARTTRYEPGLDPGVADVPPDLLARWIRAGSVLGT